MPVADAPTPTGAGRVRPARPRVEPDFEGVRRQFEEFKNRGYTAQDEEVHNRPYGQSRRPLRPDLEMSPAARRALAAFDAPVQKERFVHETDIGNVESIRKSGIRPSRGGGAMGHEGVYAYQGGAEGRQVPEGRALIEFEADPRRISGRGTTPGSRTVALSGGNVSPEDIVAGHGTAGRIFDAGTSLMALAQLAPMLPGFQERFPRASWLLSGGPLGDVAASSQEALMHETGLDQAYAPGQSWSEQVPVYRRGRGGGRLRGRYRTIQHQTPTGTTFA